MADTTGTDVVPFTEPAAVEQIRERVANLAGNLPEQLIIEDRDQAQHAVDLLTAVKRVAKDAEAERKEAGEPLLREKQFIDGRFKEVTAPLASAEAVVKAGLAAFEARERAEAERARREAQAAADAEAARQRAALALDGEERPEELVPDVVVEAPTPRSTITTGAGQASFASTLEVEVTDPKVLAKWYGTKSSTNLPVMTPSPQHLKQYARAMGGKDGAADVQVPGVKFTRGTTVRAR